MRHILYLASSLSSPCSTHTYYVLYVLEVLQPESTDMLTPHLCSCVNGGQGEPTIHFNVQLRKPLTQKLYLQERGERYRTQDAAKL